MADYKSMYYTLVRAQLKAIGILQNAHRETEKIFMDSKGFASMADTADEERREDEAQNPSK